MKTIYIFFFSFVIKALPLQAEISLKSKCTVEDEKITLGDIFQGDLKIDPTIVIGRSPEPGQKFILNAEQLRNLAKTHQVAYAPTPGDLVTIERTGQSVGIDEVRPLLIEKLHSQLPFEDFDLEFSSKDSIAVIATNEPLQIEINDIKLNTSQDRVSARVLINETPHRLNARIIERISIPALKENKAAGDIIQAQDLEWIKIPNNSSATAYILTEKALIGTTPRQKMLKALQPIRKHDVMIEKFVEKGSFVQAVVQGDNLVIQMQVRALESGGIGDHIRLINPDTKRTLHGIIKDKNVVEVSVPKAYTRNS